MLDQIIPVRCSRVRQPDALSASPWVQRYGRKHHLHRISTWPEGIVPLVRVRLYWRAGHFVLQWWDPAIRRNLSDRVDGDIIAAIARARQIDQRLIDFKAGGHGGRRIQHRELVERFLGDLQVRVDAGQLQPSSLARYRSALAHYLAFVDQRLIADRWPLAGGVDRPFALAFAAFLADRHVAPNGTEKAVKHRMKATSFILDAARAMFSFAADPDRGRLLPEGFRNPFLRPSVQCRRCGDPFGEPDITTAMAEQFLRACDDYRLRIFSLLILLRPACLGTCIPVPGVHPRRLAARAL